MTATVNQPLLQPEPKRDRWGRYLLPDPGQPGATSTLPWTRATTFAKSISDTFGLAKWQTRMAVKGVTMRPDLYALAASAPIDDKTTLDRVAEAAKEAAGTTAGANQGTALHTFTERIDRGETVQVPPPWDADVAAYVDALDQAKLAVDAALIERIVVLKQFHVAGTFDRLVRAADGRLLIGDLKTGKDLSYGWLEIAIQLALYARADAVWNGITEQYEPMPAVDLETAVVMHLPVGKGTCTLYSVDIAAGWELAQLCAAVRTARTRKDLAVQLKQARTNRAPAAVMQQEAANQLNLAIQRATSRADIDRLWEPASRRGIWTDTHTATAKKRLAELSAH